jgi:hypothetical protein
MLRRGAALPKMQRFLAAGGQTPAGEIRLADLAAELDQAETS